MLLTDRLKHAIAQSQRYNQLLAVAYLDLDGFKSVNDGHGHDIGDQLLVTIGGTVLQVSTSIGVTLYPQDGATETGQLLRHADQAMYQAKREGKTVTICSKCFMMSKDNFALYSITTMSPEDVVTIVVDDKKSLHRKPAMTVDRMLLSAEKIPTWTDIDIFVITNNYVFRFL